MGEVTAAPHMSQEDRKVSKRCKWRGDTLGYALLLKGGAKRGPGEE
jgi:hypothetical protein